jgi:hypothetical protein
MRSLTKHERLILALLEEAGEEDLATLINTARLRPGPDDEVEALGSALKKLINRDFVEIARARDRDFFERNTVPKEESVALVSNLKPFFHWSPTDRLWMWRKDLPRAEALLTETGRVEARKILSEDGWPLGDDGQPL